MTTSPKSAFIELDESGKRIEVYFTADKPIWKDTKDAVKAVPGRYHPTGEHGPHWSVNCNLRSARKLREIFGIGLTMGDAVRAWGREAASRERNLGSLAIADDHPLESLGISKTHPELAAYLRPYQRADVAMMAETNVVNANQPGTGKTVEVLAALAEAGLTTGAHLIVAPVRSLENVWRVEIERWMPGTVYTAEDATERREAVLEGLTAARGGENVWILLNIEMLRLKTIKDGDTTSHIVRGDHKGNHFTYQDDLHAEILAFDWTSLTVDEFHKMGLPERDSLSTKSADIIKSGRRFLLSGTPMGGKPYKLFAPLRSIAPKEFSSYWRWANEWLTVEVTEQRVRGGAIKEVREVGGIKPGTEDKFYEAHAPYLVRRLKREALPGLPAKTQIIVPCGMTKSQAKQYERFEKDAEVAIGDGEMISADNVLAEYTRLKQIANAYCTLDAKGNVIPTKNSGKLTELLGRLDEFGIRKADPEPGARAIVASQSKRMVEMVSAELTKAGIANDMLTGDTKDSKPIIDRFEDGSETPYVIVMTTQTGGVSLNLESAGSVHILDESWNPDDEEQLEDRGDRGTRTTSLMCLYYRTTDTIQEYIAAVASDKRITNKEVLDLHREIKKARAAK